MTVYIDDVLAFALAQRGDRYVFGAQASIGEKDPKQFDCSDLVRWACGRAGVVPAMPDGSWMQYRHCRDNDTVATIAFALHSRGGLLFKFSSNPLVGGRPSEAHVAFSLGDGTTFEARGRRWGVNSWPAYDRGWTHAALIPGCSYRPRAVPAPVPTPQPLEDEMPDYMIRPSGQDVVYACYPSGRVRRVGPAEFAFLRGQNIPYADDAKGASGEVGQDGTLADYARAG